MCIYCNTDNYRKIYENHIGPIPREVNGRTYDIHHIDGNRDNNNPINLIALSIQEHYDLHFSQKEYNACLRIAAKMKLSPAQLSKLATLNNLNRVADKTHPFLGGKVTRNLNAKTVAEGTHPFLGGKIQQKTAAKRIKAGKHQFLTRPDGSNLQTDRVKNGTHPSQTKIACLCCKKLFSVNVFTKHNDKCKSIKVA